MNMWPLEIAHSKATPSNKNALPRKTKRRKGCKSCCTHLIWWLIHVCWASFSMPLPQLLPPPSGLLSSRSESLRSKVRHSLCPLLEKAAPPRLHFGQKLVLPIRAPTVQRLTNLMYFLTYFITNYQSRFCLFSVCSNIYIYIPFRGITRERALSLYLCCFCNMRCQKASRTKRKETNCLRRALASILLAEWTCAEAMLFNWPQASRKFYGGVLWESAFADGWLKCMTIGWLI